VFVRCVRADTDGVPDAYQALIPLDSFPDTGIAWPRCTIFKVLDDLTRPDTVLDWTIHTTFSSAESAVLVAQNVITNIADQYRQRGRHASSDDELVRKLASGRELASELKRGAAERGVNPAIVIAAGAGDPDTLNRAVTEVLRTGPSVSAPPAPPYIPGNVSGSPGSPFLYVEGIPCNSPRWANCMGWTQNPSP